MFRVRALLALSLLVSSCGGRVFDDQSDNASGVGGTEKAEEPDASSSAPPSTPTSSPVADATPPPDAVVKVAPDATPPPPADAGKPSLVSCSDGPATGSPTGCGPAKTCNAGDTVTDAWAKDLLSCFVDRCAVATTGKPWCGTIGLKFGADGCTVDYVESGPGTAGCVKYQGYYRAWPCLAGGGISVTRPCP